MQGWRGRFYMFASFKNAYVHRGTAVLAADTPMGPFEPWSDGCVTPGEWECLDGAFYVSRDGRPYMAFCHKWVQAGNGEGRLEGLWAGFSGNGYTEGIAISENGEIDGRFRQLPPPFDRDGGHATVFNAFDGRIMMTLHSPSIHPLERPRFVELREKDGYLCRA